MSRSGVTVLSKRCDKNNFKLVANFIRPSELIALNQDAFNGQPAEAKVRSSTLLGCCSPSSSTINLFALRDMKIPPQRRRQDDNGRCLLVRIAPMAPAITLKIFTRFAFRRTLRHFEQCFVCPHQGSICSCRDMRWRLSNDVGPNEFVGATT